MIGDLVKIKDTFATYSKHTNKIRRGFVGVVLAEKSPRIGPSCVEQKLDVNCVLVLSSENIVYWVDYSAISYLTRCGDSNDW